MPRLDRRQLLAGSVASLATAAIATACGDESPTSATASTASAAGMHVLAAMFPRSEPYIVAGESNRLPFLVAAGDGAPLDGIDRPFRLEARRGDAALGEIPTQLRGTGLARPFVAASWTPPEPGFYELDGYYGDEKLPPVALQVVDPAELTIPRVGSPLPIVSTPTTANAAGVNPICTADPPCPLHEVDLAQRQPGRPVAVLLSTPAYCQTAICGPVLELFVEATATRDRLDAIHVEVYANPTEVDSITQARLSPAMDAWGYPFEPVLMVADAAGTLVRRLDLTFDGDEITEALDAVA